MRLTHGQGEGGKSVRSQLNQLSKHMASVSRIDGRVETITGSWPYTLLRGLGLFGIYFCLTEIYQAATKFTCQSDSRSSLCRRGCQTISILGVSSTRRSADATGLYGGIPVYK